MSETYRPDSRPKALVKANVGKAAGVTAGALAVATALIAANEGEALTAYVDRLGKGDPISWCYGETSGDVREGQKFTHEQCLRALSVSARRHAEAVQRCLPPGLPDKTAGALYDFGYNVGSTTFCKSSISRSALRGDLKDACERITLYVYTKGRDCRVRANRCYGIVRRRLDERALCLEGLK